MATIVCPFCKAFSSFTAVTTLNIPVWLLVQRTMTGATFNYQALQCTNTACGMGIFGLMRDGEIHEHWPARVGGKEFPDVPEHIGAAADEAHRCLSIGANRAAVAMARAVVEASAKDHKVTSGNLRTKIDELAKAGVISESMKDAANEIRFAGNGAAHGDLVDEAVEREDAEEILSLMDAILTRVDQEPRQVERVRERRQARKG
jgi:hypothetical protein